MCGMHFHGSRVGHDVDSDEMQEGREQAFFGFVQKMAGIVMICLAIWLFTGAGYFWPAWVILGVGVKIGIHARHTFGRSSSPSDIYS